LIKKERQDAKLQSSIFVLFFMIPTSIEIFRLRDIINGLFLVLILMFFGYWKKKFDRDRSHYKTIYILTDETYIIFQEDVFSLSTPVRTIDIPYDDPYLKVRLLYSQLCFNCFWGTFSFSKSDLLDADWNDLIEFIDRKSHLVK